MKIFKVKNLNRNKILTVFLVGLFILSALTVIDSSFASSNGGSHALASTSTDSFTFPYQYGTPSVPPNVGAQGIQGPTIPISDIGASGTQGSSLKPLNLSDGNLTFSLLLYNGTVSSQSVAVGVSVSLYNYSSNVNLTVKTDLKGYANFTGLRSGPYFLETHPSSSYISFSYWLSVFKSKSMVAYDIPSTYYGVSFGTGTDSAVIGASYPQQEFELYNVSSSSVLGYSFADKIGNSLNATFMGLSSVYSYSIKQVSISTITNINYSTNIPATSTFSPTSAYYRVSFTGPLSGYDSSTATITGSQISGGDWSISQNTHVSNGTIVINPTATIIGQGVVLTFTNVNVIINFTNQYYFGSSSSSISSHIYFNSSKTYFAENPFGDMYDPFQGIEQMSFRDSYIFGDSLTTLLIGSNSIQFYMPSNTWANNSYIYGMASIGQNSFNSYNSFLENSSFIPISANYDTFSNITFPYYSGGSASNTFRFNMTVENSLFTGVLTGEGINYNYSYHDTYKDNLFSGFIPANAQLGEGTMIFQYNTIIASYPSYLNFNSTIAYYGHKYGLYSTGGGNIFVSGNISFNKFIRETPSVGDFRVHGSYNVYDNYMVSNITENQFISFATDSRIANNTQSSVGQPLSIQITPGEWGNISYNYITNAQFTNGNRYGDHVNFTHNYWANQVSFFMGQDLIAHNIQNNTFGNIEDWGSSIAPYEDVDYNNVYNGINPDANEIIANNTFEGFLAGGDGNGGTGPGSNRGPWDIAVNHNNATIVNNVFYNNKFSGELNLNDSAIGGDIAVCNSSKLMVTGNWFLNLNNMTIPFYITKEKNGSVDNNHFFYNQFNGFPATLTSISHDSLYQNDTYAFLTSGAFGIGANQQYSYNTTIKTGYQQLYYFNGPPADGGYFVYQIVPDVSTLSGTPVISYDNGYAGGPQPNFTWKGYNYTESVEPTYIQVGVNSSKAPSIGIAFNGVAGELYHVQVINGNDVIQNISVVANSNGVVQVTYNPSTMPLDPIFNLIPPPSPSSPVHVILKKTLSYTKLIAISASLLVIVAVAYFYTKSSGGKSGSGGGERRI